jgi:hypothetical protein
VFLCGVFLLAVFTRIAFPTFSKALGDRVDGVTNYRAAFAAIGEGLSGEKKFSVAFAEAWGLAFNPKSPAEDANTARPTPSVPAFNENTANHGDDPVSDAAAEFTDAVAAWRMISPDAWSGFGLPTGV